VFGATTVPPSLLVVPPPPLLAPPVVVRPPVAPPVLVRPPSDDAPVPAVVSAVEVDMLPVAVDGPPPLDAADEPSVVPPLAAPPLEVSVAVPEVAPELAFDPVPAVADVADDVPPPLSLDDEAPAPPLEAVIVPPVSEPRTGSGCEELEQRVPPRAPRIAQPNPSSRTFFIEDFTLSLSLWPHPPVSLRGEPWVGVPSHVAARGEDPRLRAGTGDPMVRVPPRGIVGRLVDDGS
jgi:hypothetical protein